MSELKAYIGPHTTDHTLTEYYLKSEADKVIAELKAENERMKKMNFNPFLPKELVRKLSGFFMLEENCRGYDPNTPIGEIAEHAFKHWQRHEQEVDKLKRVIRHKDDLLEVEKEKVAEARRTVCDYQEIINEKERQERHHKYKRCLAMADMNWWQANRYSAAEMVERIRGNFEEATQCSKLEEKYLKRYNKWLALAEEPTWAKFLQLIHKEAK